MSDDGLGVQICLQPLGSEPILLLGPADLGVDTKPRLSVLKTTEPPGRKAGIKVGSPAELVAKLKDAGVI